MFQNFQLIATLTALENVMLPRTAWRPDARTGPAMLERVGLGARLQQKPWSCRASNSSAGADAVVQPTMLMADTTGSLDHDTGMAVMDLMFKAEPGKGAPR